MGPRIKMTAGVVGLAALVAVLLVAGCGSGGTSTTGQSSTTSQPVSTASSGASTTLSGASTSTVEQSSTTAAGDLDLGKAIYLTGTDLSGQPIPRSGGVGMMGSGGCVTCHGPDGKGGTISMMMGTYDVPDIRWSTISQPMQMNGETEPPYDPTTFARAVRDGIGSDGDQLESVMPRWQLTDPQVQGLIAYLESL